MLSDKIKSLRETINKDYERPDEDKVQEYKDALNLNSKALEYLKEERGLEDTTIEYFNLGYDEYRDAISIPIYKDGELVNIKYRLLEPEDFKYTGEKGAEPWIFHDEGISKGLKKKGVLIVEGEFDLMSVWQAGIENVVSPSGGKDSYGIWLERLEDIPRVYIAYDNDKAGKEASLKLADRLSVDKCAEVVYPDGYKDANEYLQDHDKEDYLQLVREARPFYTYQFKGLGDIIDSLRSKSDPTVETEYIPNVKMEKDWLMVVSGRSNVGKTSYTMNLADDLASKGIPTLIMPFERGIESVGKRFLQVKFRKTYEDFSFMNDEEWDDVIEDCIETPIYFSTPRKDQIVDTIIKSKRLFDTRFVIIDHLDYVVRNTSSREAEIGSTLQHLKRVAEDNGVIICVVTHVRKVDVAGANEHSRINIEDLKGSSSLYQDPECVLLLHGSGEGTLEVEVAKNKGPMITKVFGFDASTGSLSETGDEF